LQSSNQSEAELTLSLLRAIDKDKSITQRTAAREIGVALGLVNAYLKRCVKKGLVKVIQAPSRRYMYYLTPKGLSEKSRLTAEFLKQSLSLFRQAQSEYHTLMQLCEAHGYKRLALCGMSDLAEVASLCARDFDLSIVGIIDPEASNEQFHSLKVYSSRAELSSVDAYIVTALQNTQAVYDRLVEEVPQELVLVPTLLEIMQLPESGENGRQ